MAAPVLLVDDRHDVLELNRILLEAEGYETEGCSYAEVTMERLQQRAPRVMLLDLVPGDEAPWALLRRLRREPATQGVGVVVTSDSPVLVERATADGDFGVAVGLVMPFDIEALYRAVATAARHGQIPAPVRPPSPTLLHGTAALRDARSRILLRWVQRLSLLDTFRQRPDLSLAEVQGHGKALLDGVVDSLDLVTVSGDGAVVGVSLDAAQAHACLRRAQGVRAGDLAREVTALRREIWREVQGDPQLRAASLDDLWDLLRRLTVALDGLLYALLDTWDKGD